MVKYICFSGHVISQSDQETHFIPASRLPQLYGVRKDECIIVNDRMEMRSIHLITLPNGLIPLTPDPLGIYKIPGTKWTKEEVIGHLKRNIGINKDFMIRRSDE